MHGMAACSESLAKKQKQAAQVRASSGRRGSTSYKGFSLIQNECSLDACFLPGRPCPCGIAG